jgi:hypothetical protein
LPGNQLESEMTKLAQKISIHPVPKEILAVARTAMRAGLSEEQAILVARITLLYRKVSVGQVVAEVVL